MKNHANDCTVVTSGICSCFDIQPEYVAALKTLLKTREAELLETRGACSNTHCTLHFKHRGPCFE